ncbi:unnamed protein product [Phytophthora lilii]|uniref:Unnamed protein product n=1 Tax=Phytophthora lilii TaxID=2077276 RepID=A0A9W6WVZ0_9STRA|nr:unnamed protein product [Phytophthora lilii]
MKTSFPTEEDTTAGLTEYVRWEYAFEPAIPENLFEKLAVATYSPLLRSERIYASSCFIDKISGSSHTCVAKEDSTLNEPMDIMSSVLSVTVVASDRTLAWKQLVWYCMNLENLLKTYPGLLITRSTVSQRNQRYNVDQLLSDQEHFMQLNICTNQEYLPADMEWYTNRSRPGKEIFDKQAAAVEPTNNVSLDTTVALIHEGLYKLNASIENQKESMDYQFQQNAERIDAAVGNLQRFQIALITGMENKAKFPSLWTLEYRGFDDRSSHTVSSSLMASLQRKITTTVVIKFRSELSGICYHEPIVISAAREVFSRFGKCLKVRQAVS